jgi:O-antigen/teichoic acid export membrane protein
MHLVLTENNLARPNHFNAVRKRLFAGTALNFIAMAFNQGSTLLANIIAARILMKEGFGEFAIVQSTLLTLATLSQLATGYTASKHIAEYRSTSPAKAGRIMALCSIASWVLAGVGTILNVIMASWITGTFFKAPHLEHTLVIGSGFLFFSAINGYQIGVLSGLEAYRSLAKAGCASGIIALIVISVGALAGGLNGSVLGLSVSALARCWIHNTALRVETKANGIGPEYKGLSQERSIITRFALPASIAGYYSMPIIWMANSLLVRQPGGYSEMAIYASASYIRLLVLFMPQVINNVSLSILNNIKGSGDNQRYGHAYKYNILLVFGVTVVAALFFGVFGASVLSLFGRDFRAGKAVLQVLMISTVFEGLSVALYQHIQAQGKIWLSFFLISFPRESAFIMLAFLLIPSHGAFGLSLAYTSVWLLTLITIAIIVHQERGKVGRTKSYIGEKRESLAREGKAYL